MPDDGAPQGSGVGREGSGQRLSTFRAFGLSLFALAITAVLLLGWRHGEPWTAAAFSVLLSSRVWRALILRPFGPAPGDDPARRATRFVRATAAGWLGSGVIGLAAVTAGEGTEWLFVAPIFLVLGALNLWVALAGAPSRTQDHTPAA